MIESMAYTDQSKDNMNTVPSLGMHTTAGALAFLNNVPSSNASIVDKVCTLQQHKVLG